MKRLICFVLAAVLVAGLCACGTDNTTAKNKEGLHVGFGQADITPAFGVPLGGYGNVESRLAANLLDKLYVSCLAFQDGEDVLLLYSFDAIRSQQNWTDELRARVSVATGVKKENIMVTSTHTHSAPELNYSGDNVAQTYRDLYMAGALEAAQAAIADMDKATMSMGTVTTEKMAYVRHYEMRDGSYAGSNFGDFSYGIKDYATKNDPEMRLVKIDRENEEKTDILLCNWQVHPCFTGGAEQYNISADFIGAARNEFKTQTGMEFFYIQGAAGNQSGFSLIAEDTNGLDNMGYGKALAKYAMDAMPNLTAVEGSGIAVVSKDVEYTVNREGADEETQKKAKEVVDLWVTSDSRDLANALAKEYGIQSVYEANAILDRAGRTKETEIIHLDVTRVGGIAFVHAPYEMFADNSLYIKEKSVFGENTVIATMSNGAWGYFPTKFAYQYGCYESYSAMFTAGVAEDMANEFLSMLEEVKAPAATEE